MSRNLGRKIHHINQSNTHVKLMNEIADVKSLLNTSTQMTKDLKTWLNELSMKKKDAGKSPRKTQAPSNRFDTPVLKIQGLSSLIETMSLATSITTNSVSASDVASSRQPLDDNSVSTSDVASSGQPLDDNSVSASDITSSGQPLDDSEMQNEVTPCEIPLASFDFDFELFNQMLEQEPIPEPTEAELVAHAFLREVLGK